jgi:predicted dehydrogenase
MPYRILQVGVWGFGRSWLGTVSKATSVEVELAGLVDTDCDNLERARELAKVGEAACFESVDDALAATRPDICLCVTPPSFHREVALKALEAGSHVIIEKPFAETYEDAEAVVAAAERAGRKLAVSQNYRYSAAALTAREVVRTGRFGEPASFTMEFYNAPRFTTGFRAGMEHILVIDMSIHHYDLMRSVLGREAVWTCAREFNPAWSWLNGKASVLQLIGFEGDVVGQYSATWCTKGAPTPWSGLWRIECSEGSVIWEGESVRGLRGEEVEEVPVKEDEGPRGQELVLAEFVRAIEEDREPETSGRDNLKTLRMAFATIESSRTGRLVEL